MYCMFWVRATVQYCMVESGPVRAFAWPVLLTLGVCRAAEEI